MVDGINITNPRLSGTVENGGVAPKTAVKSGDAQPSKEASQEVRDTSVKVSSVIAKSAEKRLTALSTANVGDFVKAAEKIIDASLPSKPPGTRLRINLDSDSGRFVYQGVDINTGDVVTQFPSEKILKFVAFNRERDSHEGIVVDEEA